MGRKRSPENVGLPKGMIFNKKGQTYYLRVAGQKDIRLGVTLSEAYRNYYSFADINFEVRTMHDLIERYLKEISPTKAESTHSSNIQSSKHLIKRFGHMKPELIRAKHAYQYLDLRSREGAPVRANREFALLSTVMSCAVKWGIIDDTPFHKIERNKEKPRDRLVTNQELASFLKCCPRWLQLYVELKLSIGLRQTDMLNLSSKDWDENEGLKVQTSKTKKRILFEPTSYITRIIQNLRVLNGYRSKKGIDTPILHWHFFASGASSRKDKPLTPDGFRTAWNKAMRKAEAEGLINERFQERDLRAKAASDCQSLLQAFELLGHSSMSTTDRVYRRGYTKVLPLSPNPEVKLKKTKN